MKYLPMANMKRQRCCHEANPLCGLMKQNVPFRAAGTLHF